MKRALTYDDVNIVSKYKCFECGDDENIVFHHVVPKSLGGTKTIPLCELHHSMIHTKNLMSMSKLKDKKKIELFKNGFWGSGIPPIGYEIVGRRTQKKLIINDTEAEIIFYIFKKTYELIGKNLYSKAMITRRTINDLNKKNYTINGKKITRWNIRDILTNSMYIGKLGYGGKSYEHLYGNIINKKLFEKIQSWRDMPDIHKPQKYVCKKT